MFSVIQETCDLTVGWRIAHVACVDVRSYMQPELARYHNAPIASYSLLQPCMFEDSCLHLIRAIALIPASLVHGLSQLKYTRSVWPWCGSTAFTERPEITKEE